MGELASWHIAALGSLQGTRSGQNFYPANVGIQCIEPAMRVVGVVVVGELRIASSHSREN